MSSMLFTTCWSDSNCFNVKITNPSFHGKDVPPLRTINWTISGHKHSLYISFIYQDHQIQQYQSEGNLFLVISSKFHRAQGCLGCARLRVRRQREDVRFRCVTWQTVAKTRLCFASFANNEQQGLENIVWVFEGWHNLNIVLLPSIPFNLHISKLNTVNGVMNIQCDTIK